MRRDLSARAARPIAVDGGAFPFVALWRRGGLREAGMGFGQAIAACLSKYADFQGRAARPEYWWFVLFNAVTSALASIVDKGLIGYPVLQTLVAFGLIIPTVAVAVRRLHDTDRSGWRLLIVFVPLIGGVALLVWFCFRGAAGDNRFGPAPQAA
jgi:uncharacterized membrane protein YhaH (DUF805 family)